MHKKFNTFSCFVLYNLTPVDLSLNYLAVLIGCCKSSYMSFDNATTLVFKNLSHNSRISKKYKKKSTGQLERISTYSQFHSASELFRNSLVIQVTWRYVTRPNQPIKMCARNMEASVNRQLSSNFVCLCLGKETISFVRVTGVIQNIKFGTVLSILVASKTNIKAVLK